MLLMQLITFLGIGILIFKIHTAFRNLTLSICLEVIVVFNRSVVPQRFLLEMLREQGESMSSTCRRMDV